MCVMPVLSTGDTMVGATILVNLTMVLLAQSSLGCDLVSMLTVSLVHGQCQCRPGQCPRGCIMTGTRDMTRDTV